MKSFAVAAVIGASSVNALCEVIQPAVALISAKASEMGHQAEHIETIITPVVKIIDNSQPQYGDHGPQYNEYGEQYVDYNDMSFTMNSPYPQSEQERIFQMEDGSIDAQIFVQGPVNYDQTYEENMIDIDTLDTQEIILMPEPTANTNEEAEKPPGYWTDQQKLTLETFKEVVATDVDNVWVIAYIDPRCRDCVTLSVEWERLTQIEEKERRKIKLGYVDISVTENWKIVQDHTKGKKMTHTPAVTLYGDNKESPYWYEKETQPSADGVHTWVSNYADHFGYGYWDPDCYEGTCADPSHAHYNGLPHGHHHSHDGHAPDGINRHGYGIGAREHYDSPNHEGALEYAGVAVGANGKGYMKEGKWLAGDQVTQLKKTEDETIMRRRTVSEGGKTTGLAHQPNNGLTSTTVHVGDYDAYGAHDSYGGHDAYGIEDSYVTEATTNGFQRKSRDTIVTTPAYDTAGWTETTGAYGGQTAAYGASTGYGQAASGYGAQSAYGQTGYGQSAYGQSAYGKAAYGKSSAASLYNNKPASTTAQTKPAGYGQWAAYGKSATSDPYSTSSAYRQTGYGQSAYGDAYGSAYGDAYGSSAYGSGAYGDAYGSSAYGSAYGDAYGSLYGDAYGSAYGSAYGDAYGDVYGDAYGTAGYDASGYGASSSYGDLYDQYGYSATGPYDQAYYTGNGYADYFDQATTGYGGKSAYGASTGYGQAASTYGQAASTYGQAASGYGAQSAYGQTGYGQSAYGQSAYGKSAYGKSSAASLYNNKSTATTGYGQSATYGQNKSYTATAASPYGTATQKSYTATASPYGSASQKSYASTASPYGASRNSYSASGQYTGAPASTYNSGYGSYGQQSGSYGQQSGSYGQNSGYGSSAAYGSGSYGSQQSAGAVAGKAKGSYSNPNVQYMGPGLDNLLNSGYETRVDEKTGMIGIVLGKYTTTNTTKKRTVDFDEVEIAAKDSQMYKDAMDLALNSGQGYSAFNPLAEFEGMQEAMIGEDVPDESNLNQQIYVPDTPVTPDF